MTRDTQLPKFDAGHWVKVARFAVAASAFLLAVTVAILLMFDPPNQCPNWHLKDTHSTSLWTALAVCTTPLVVIGCFIAIRWNWVARRGALKLDELEVKVDPRAEWQQIYRETWRLQRDFYAQRGLKAWNEDLVPSYITNNPFIAEIFAGIVAAFVQDCMSSVQPGYQSLSAENPLRILELGAGTGKFSYLFCAS